MRDHRFNPLLLPDPTSATTDDDPVTLFNPPHLNRLMGTDRLGDTSTDESPDWSLLTQRAS